MGMNEIYDPRWLVTCKYRGMGDYVYEKEDIEFHIGGSSIVLLYY